MKTLYVLVIDNEPAIRRAISRLLNSKTIYIRDFNEEVMLEILEAGSAANADTLLKASPPDIIIVDHELPDKNGLEFIEELSVRHLDCMSIMMSAYASVETVVAATKMGAYDFLAKPFTPEELLASIRKAAKHLLLKRHAQKLAEEKRQVRFQSISVLAHELKAPLGSIEGYLQILKDGTAVKDDTTYKRIIDRSLVRLDGMRKLIMDLLDLTRIESGQKKRDRIQVDLRELVVNSMETVEPRSVERKINLTLHCDHPVNIVADRNEMEMVINNLITNAVTYNKDNGSVDITLSMESDNVTIKVADTGIGMSEAEAARVFEEFYRAKNQKTKKILGSGLGLAVVKKIVSICQGSIDLKTQPDVGSTFTVVLPRSSESLSDPAPNPGKESVFA
jgi:two-component system, sensor histidine kinase and response regulator